MIRTINAKNYFYENCYDIREYIGFSLFFTGFVILFTAIFIKDDGWFIFCYASGLILCMFSLKLIYLCEYHNTQEDTLLEI